VASLVFACGVGSLVAVVLGVMAKRQIRERGEGGDGLATAGIVLGVLGLLAVLLFVALVVLGTVFGEVTYEDSVVYPEELR
jgi:hypothetical protein